MKAIIFNGGVGTRLHAITKSLIPKGHIIFKGRPLIAYQIEWLNSAGIKDILIAYSRKEQIEQLKYFYKKRLVPRLKYTFSLSPTESSDSGVSLPYFNFRSPETQNFIRENIFVTVNGDNLFRTKLLSKIINQHKQTGRDVFCIYRTKKKSPFVIDSRRGEIYNLRWVTNQPDKYWNHTTCGTCFFSADAYKLIQSKINKLENPDIQEYIELSLKAGRKLDLVKVDFFINMNEYEDYVRAVKFLKKYD